MSEDTILTTRDLIIKKAVFEDWHAIWQNLWRHAESARYMLWEPTYSEEDAKDRMRRTIEFERTHEHCFFVYEKRRADLTRGEGQPGAAGSPAEAKEEDPPLLCGDAIGFAGVEKANGAWREVGVALGPAFTGRGYGKQVLRALGDYVFGCFGAERFLACCRSGNAPSRKVILACGFSFTHKEEMIDPRDDEPYIMEYYEVKREDWKHASERKEN